MGETSQLSNIIPLRRSLALLNARQAERSLAVIGKLAIDRASSTFY